MLGHQLVVVSDAHVDGASDVEPLLAFLETVPSLGDCLLINGDLFEFWFSYRRVVPRAGFLVAAALAMLRRKVPIVMTGGNHDRWGDSFWQRDANILFTPGEVRLQVGDRSILAAHGDGLSESTRSASATHSVITHPATARVFGWLHPDVGLWLVDRLRGRLADTTRDPAALARGEARQLAWVTRRLSAEPGIHLLILSHTHRPCLLEPVPGQRFLNPGAWVEGRRFAVVSAQGVELRQFPGP
jgi:UDP-2,3-diacylglucosamine hydrolase